MKGFTLIELIIVSAIVSLSASLSLNFYSNFHVSSQLNENTSYLIQALRTAKERSIERKNNYEHGVFFQADRYVLYQDVVGGDDDKEIILDGGLTLNWNLNDSSDRIYFSKSFGVPSTTGTLTLRSPSGEERKIDINSLGLVEEQ